MEQFSLEKYLENPSRKVVTRDGRQVRIVCWDLKSNTPIIAAIQWNQEREDCYCYNTIGRCANNVGELDLFFADEEKELTEFEKKLKEVLYEHATTNTSSEEKARQYASELIDLARKELEKNYYTKVLDDRIVFKSELYSTDLQTAYSMGKQDALKDFPKWKKAKNDEELDCHVAIQQDNRVVLSDFVQKDEYYITFDVLKRLPKE